jgi:transglutaminase-like putative cysteine protease
LFHILFRLNSRRAYFPESESLADFLRSTAVVDADHPRVTAAAERVARGATNVEKARQLFEFVRDEISHGSDIRANVVTCRASDVLAERTGICYAKSHLLAALLRTVGIPAGFCYQRLCKDAPGSGFELHGFNGVYLASLGRWIRLDARGNKPGINAQFDVAVEKLAFSVDESRGEVAYPTIYPEPAACVVAALTRHSRLDDLLANLPGGLEST